ncbi:Non-reducing end beta-L-arabinofuranosidase [Frondihabitans sp. 762G35]|uniref:glycoside hydrolase family 127 protein n=1 Tax=Frondihabitans sp. 762G35 TaxID=1446794 RepID=UPI000D21C67B|nr:beta-L-arabinofuranosidase domain-containing protein [Frondihabitans sp. 762G35]ARC58553.1 Non-reducing end beta-L-arabinofuranosidase [Frondihabitans sp. 762G35]
MTDTLADPTLAETPATRLRGGPVMPTSSLLHPLTSAEIRLTGGYWRRWQRTNAEVVLGHCESWMERIGWIGNFDRAASSEPGWEHAGIEFVDSEVYKLLEGMAWELGRSDDAELADRYERLVARVAAAQEPDGYLHTSFGRPWQRARYSDLEWGHELYCFGHLIQAAVARIRTAGSGLLVDVAVRLADHVYETFGPDGREAVCGHPEIEPALAELGRATGDRRYIELARLFVERRGHGLLRPIEYGQEYFQDDLPVREAATLRGHAVRALYLAAGALDVAVETGDETLAAAVEEQWRHTVATRTYLTGGMGSHHQDEAYGVDFELPPDRAYSETCAGIGSNMLSWRLLLQSGDPAYADLLERTLLNNVMASPREDGAAFFYTNTLHQRNPGTVPAEDDLSVRALSSLRAPWFEVSCCPTNVARTLASVELYFATKTADGVQIHQYGEFDVDTTLDSGAPVVFSVTSGYPYRGSVVVTSRAETRRPVTLTLRIPAWAGHADVQVGSEGVSRVTGRTVEITRVFHPGDVITLDLPMDARWVTPDPRIDAVRGTVAVERGPLVLCLEQAADGPSVNDVVVDTSATLWTTDRGAAVTGRRAAVDSAPWPYGKTPATLQDLGTLQLVPYSTWANHGPSTMRVWLPAPPTPRSVGEQPTP